MYKTGHHGVVDMREVKETQSNGNDDNNNNNNNSKINMASTPIVATSNIQMVEMGDLP